MKNLNERINKIMKNYFFLAPWFLRLGLGTAFIFHGIGKFPLPPQKLIDYFDFSPVLASFVALAELFSGIFLIIGGFLKSYFGELMTRVSSLVIITIMFFAFNIAHRDWFFNAQLFTSEQIFLTLLGFYFLITGNNNTNE